MKLSKLFVIALLAGTLGVLGCGDDDGNGNGGNGGNGGTAGTGGTGGGGGVDLGCDEGRCVEAAQADKCEDGIGTCIIAEPANEEECIAAGNLIFCNEGAGGTGGNGGTGGTGGAGGAPDPDVVCNEGLCASEGQPKDDCKLYLAECLANNPALQDEECVAGVQLIFCGV
jgi:hypothetical protein